MNPKRALHKICALWETFVLAERMFLGFLLMTLVVGIWHALPILGVIGDEAPFVGGVLREISVGSIIPHTDYSYTLSFYANYALMLPVLALMYALSGFSVPGLLDTLTVHHYLLYLIPRTVTLLAALGTAALLLSLGREEAFSVRSRLLVVGLYSSTLIVSLIDHTGKMWGLSVFLAALSVFFAARTVRRVDDRVGILGSPSFWSIGFAFLSFANFPPAVVMLSVVPFFLFLYRKDLRAVHRIILSTLVWSAVFLALFFLNFHGWVTQNAITDPGGAPAASVYENIVHHMHMVFLLLPFLVLVVLLRIGSVTNKPLLTLLLVELFLYVGIVSVRAPWAAGSVAYYRYEFFVAFFLVCILFTLRPRWDNVVALLLGVSLIFWLKILILLALPTTYNGARDTVVEDLGGKDVVVRVEVEELDLPKNSPSYTLNSSAHCASRCQAGREKEFAPDLHYLVVDDETDPAAVQSFPDHDRPVYVITDTRHASIEPLFGFTNGLTDGFLSVEHGLGAYDIDLFRVKRLGRPIFVYPTTPSL